MGIYIYDIYIYIHIYIRRDSTKTKVMKSKYAITVILNFMIYGKTVYFTAWHTAEMDLAQKFI